MSMDTEMIGSRTGNGLLPKVKAHECPPVSGSAGVDRLMFSDAHDASARGMRKVHRDHDHGSARQWLARLPVACLAACLMFSSPVMAGPRFQPREQVVMQNSLIEGAQISVSLLSWQGTVDDAMNDLERQWADRDLPPMRSSRDGWQVITHMDGEVIESIELRKAGRLVEGRRVRLKPDETASARLREDERWFRTLLPASAQLQPSISHRDGDHQTSTLVAWTDDSVVNLSGWVGRKLARQGFSALSLPDEARTPHAQTVLYAKGGEEAAVTVSRQGMRQFVVIHWRR